MSKPTDEDEARLDAELAKLVEAKKAAETISPDLLRRYVDKEITPAEKSKVEAAVAASSTIAAEVDTIRSPDEGVRAAALTGWEQGWQNALKTSDDEE